MDVPARFLIRFLTRRLWNSHEELQTFAALPTSRNMTSVGSFATMLTSRGSEVQAYSVQIGIPAPTSPRTVLFPHQSSRTTLTFPVSTTPRHSVRSPRRNRNSSLAYLRVNAPRHFSMVSISLEQPRVPEDLTPASHGISCKNNVLIIFITFR